RTRQPGLDLLRALAIIVVVIYHAGIFGFALPGRVHRFGWIGVDLFFVLSGYLIGGQLLAALTRPEGLQLGRFFARRAFRILPAYFFILALYFGLPALREFPEISPLWKFLLSVQNIALRGGTAFSHAWSLAIEDQFYLFLPFALLALRRKPRAGLVIPCVLVLSGMALRAFLASQNPGTESEVSYRAFQRLIYYPTWTRLDPLIFGVVLAALERFKPGWWYRLTAAAPWLGLLGCGAVVFGLSLGENDLTVTTCVWQFPLIALGLAMMLLCAVSPRLPFHRFELPGAAFLASIAYSVYLSHKLVIHFVLQVCASYNLTLTSLPALLLVELFIYLGGTVLFFAVERPFLQLRHRLATRS
ncbi:MAG: acyltransferase, partial [Chthoniobacterales bacterium]